MRETPPLGPFLARSRADAELPRRNRPLDRGKRLDAEMLKRIGEWGRYKDVDGDGIPYRTVPGESMPAFFTRGSGHNAKAQYSERPDDYVENMERLARKFETARRRPVACGCKSLSSSVSFLLFSSISLVIMFCASIQPSVLSSS